MFAIVKASNHGFLGKHRAGRFFQNGAPVKLEVVPDDSVKVAPGENVAHYPKDKDGKPSMTQITRSGFELIKNDQGGLSLLADEESQEATSRAAFDELRRAALAAETEAAALRIEVATLKARIEELTAKKSADGEAKSADKSKAK